MRTWSVSGTAFALCTRSSSLSMSTRTSMGCSLPGSQPGEAWLPPRAATLLLRARGGAAPPFREELPEPRGHRGRDQLVDVSAEGGDLLHAARRDERVERAGHHV